MEKIAKKYNSQNKIALQKNFEEACQDKNFKKIIKENKIPLDNAIKYTSSLQESVQELNNCQDCPGLFACGNRLDGHYYYPNYNDGKVDFVYVPCDYQLKAQENKEKKLTNNKILANARMKDIDITDKNRVKLIKWLKDFYDNFDKYQPTKGLYLHGNFGCGKTFLISALFNELQINKNVTTHVMYLPEILRDLKDDWSLFADKINYYQTVDLLLIDDIGAEKVSEWGRDEILGTILQARMNDNLCTFFTSNFTITELEKHLALTKGNIDSVKSRRIIERIKQLTTDFELISANKRI